MICFTERLSRSLDVLYRKVVAIMVMCASTFHPQSDFGMSRSSQRRELSSLRRELSSHHKAILFFSCFGFLSMVGSCALLCAYISCGNPAQFFITIWRDLYIFPTYYVLGGSVEVSILASILYLQFQDRVLFTTTTIWQFQTIQPPPHSYHLEHKILMSTFKHKF